MTSICGIYKIDLHFLNSKMGVPWNFLVLNNAYVLTINILRYQIGKHLLCLIGFQSRSKL